VSSPRALNRRVSVELERVVLKCLEKEPENRYQSAKELAVDLRRLGIPGSATAVLAARRPARRQGMVLAVGITLVALGAVLVGLNVGGLRQRLLGGVAPGQITSIAVLPLENLMGDSEQDYFVAGMHEALITELSKIGALTVISRTSAMRYQNTDKSVPEIARELGVDAVVEGSVFRVENTVRITAQLIEAATDRHLWADNFDRELRDILALHSDVARAIANEIKIKLTLQEQARLVRPRPVDAEAYQLYLRGRYHWNQRTQEGFQKGLEFFEQALERDPTYPLAYAGLADSYNLLANYFFLPPQEAFPRAKAAAIKALEIDDTLAEAHTSLAFARHHYDWDWSGAEGEYKRALELNPGYATAHQWYAEYLTTVGRHEEAIAEIRRAQELDPLSLVIDSNVGRLLYHAHRYDQAIDELQNTLRLDPNYFWAHVFLGMAFEQKGMYAEAIAEFQKVAALSGGEPNVPLAHTYAASGRTDDARKMLKALQQRYGEDVESYFMGGIHAALGEKDEAFAWLEKAYEEHSFFLVFLKTEPWFDPLHTDPRFQDLLRRMNFPD
jgi:TolB-like protein/Tfp pilus assembly protein PilF